MQNSTLWFLAKFFWNHFKENINMYFLFVYCLTQLYEFESSNKRLSELFHLKMVPGVTMDGYDDMQLHEAVCHNCIQ